MWVNDEDTHRAVGADSWYIGCVQGIKGLSGPYIQYVSSILQQQSTVVYSLSTEKITSKKPCTHSVTQLEKQGHTWPNSVNTLA